jgi:GTP-binding protein
LPRLLALSKADLVDEDTRAARRREWSARLGGHVPVIVTSSVSRLGLEELAIELARRVPVLSEVAAEDVEREPSGLEQMAEHQVFRPAADRGYVVERTGDHSFRVSGRGVERLVARYDLDNEDALSHLERRLRGIGVIGALENEGFSPGDEVEIAGVAFDLDPDM